jgi:hypothetical protein
MQASAVTPDIASRLRASNGTWATQDDSTDPGRFAAVATALAFVVGDDTLQYLDSAVDGGAYSAEVLAIGEKLVYHLIKSEGENPLVNVLPLSSLTGIRIQSVPVPDDARRDTAEASPFLFVATFGDQEVPVPTQEGNELQQNIRYGIYGLLKTILENR